MNSKTRDMVPAQPFMRFIEDRLAHYSRMGEGRNADSSHRLCQDFGWEGTRYDSGPRKLYRYRHGISESTHGRCRKKGLKGKNVVLPRPFYPRDIVENALHHAGVLFEDVYPPEQFPDLYVDIPPEPVAWCGFCRRLRQPVLGHCMSCDCRISDEGAVAA